MSPARAALSLLSGALFCSLPVQAERWGASVAVASDHVVNGLSRTHGGPVFQAQTDWSSDDGWTAVLWGTTLHRQRTTQPDREIDLYLGKYWRFGRDWGLQTDVSRYWFSPHRPRANYDYSELSASLSFREMTTFTVAWSPDYSAYSSKTGPRLNRTALRYELTGRYPASRHLSLTTGVGYFELQNLFGIGYWYWSAGAELTFGRVSLATSYIAADETADYLFEQNAGRRIAASLVYRLR